MNLAILMLVILSLLYHFAIKPLVYWKNRGVSQTPLSETFLFNIVGLFQRNISGFIQSLYNWFPGSSFQKIRMFGIIIGLTVVLLFIYYFTIKPLYFWENQGVKQKPIVKEFMFNLFGMLQRENAAIVVQKIYNEFSNFRYCGINQLYTPILFVRDAELIKQMMVKDFEYFTDHREFVSNNNDPLWSKNLFALKGPEWRLMRPILSPSFTSSKMRAMFFLMRDAAENFANHFLKQDEDVVVIEMKDTFTHFCNDVIATTAFGVEVDSLANPDTEFYRMGKKATDLSRPGKQLRFIINMVAPWISKVLGVKFFENDVRAFFENLIIGAMKEREEKGIVRPDMIHLLMEARKHCKEDKNNIAEERKQSIEISNENIVAQALLFFFAGFDSVSTMMCFMAHELAVNTDIQEKLKLEVHETSETLNGKLTYDALVNMKYMDMVISETLRKWPTQIGIERLCTKPYTIEPILPEEKPIHLKKGSIIFIPTYGIHHDPELFPNPESFDPERFSEANKASFNSYAYQPFGMGPRNCIGSRYAAMEIKIAFFYILLNFAIVPVEKTNIPLVLAKSMFHLGAEGGFWLGLKRLKK
ncbi:cytochrome P450 9e2 isoform X2 [Leptinotarsa decemlineata]|uniref:cytochrome P450 9e2 isoform X2 n=1 Tax=Leptinotarsa decemlineata TaxID=7539 RepID=UPI003D30AE0C